MTRGPATEPTVAKDSAVAATAVPTEQPTERPTQQATTQTVAQPTTQRRRVAIIGAGPSGLFAAQALMSQDRVPVHVELFDRLPTPYGLLRYGVAPDHENIKAVGDALARTFDSGEVTFWGLIEFGRDVTRDEVLAGYDAVIYAVGADEDVRLGIPGERMIGSRSAREFVSWYGGHPDARRQDLTGVTGAAAIGVGNVAVDVARILLKDPAALERTDMPPRVLVELHSADVRDVWVVGRRGPEHASYTTKELRELVSLPGVQVSIDDYTLSTMTGDPDPKLPRRVRTNLEVLASAAAREVPDADRRLHFEFWSRPIRLHSDDPEPDEVGDDVDHERIPEKVSAMELERTRLDADGRVVGTGETAMVAVQLVLRAIGYRATPLPDVPFDTTAAVVPNVEGRVVDEQGVVQPREYCTGWVKRGPLGVIGSNKADAAQTVAHVLADLEAAPMATAATGAPVRLDVVQLLRERGRAPSTYEDWQAIDSAEIERGQDLGRVRTKLGSWQELLAQVAGSRLAGAAGGAVGEVAAERAPEPS
ncbi:ferredoxin--NADP+ reductase [Kineosphaera limosa]|uniref:FAD/NAD(P)-binding protein n=1 Tax=Kineosphaera limosa TaxID=111564 RepID=UPI0015761235|nr:FAD/NAD(P)-binding protein [Kineosphaera limosa]NYE01406.1 ferredoxin--NADP+ reductase [Kineosphaera limosa]